MSNNSVTILLSTYNGEKYLKELLDSLKRQSCKNLKIIARDDGSSDNSVDILESYGVTLINGKTNVGVKESFSILLRYALKNSDSNYFMFCDQDDVWEESKVEKSLKFMKSMEEKYGDIPLLVHSDLTVVDENLNILNKSFFKYANIRPEYDGFDKLLIQNIITGCSVLINKKLAKLCLDIPQEAIMHDWWIALVASCFGKIGFINEPLVKYRQHKQNTIGAKKFSSKYIWKKLFYSQNILDKNIAQADIFLQRYNNTLDDKTKKLLKDFVAIKDKNFLDRRKILIKHKMYKHGIIRNIGLMVKV